MPRFAVMSGDTVSNIIVGDSAEDLQAAFGGEFVEYSDENPAGIGWILNRETGEFYQLTETPAEVTEE
jgi:hypothetical protein